MSQDRHIQEAIDACRPGSRDLFDPPMEEAAQLVAQHEEYRKAYERVQKLDAEIAGVLADVPVPGGLAERILAGLALAAEQDERARGSDESDRARVIPLPGTGSQPRSRRLLLAGAVAAIAAGVAVVAWMRPATERFSRDTMHAEIRRFYESESAGPGALLTESPPPSEFPQSSFVLGLNDPLATWRAFSGLLGRKGIAYEFHNRGTKATLYVLRLRGPLGSPDLADVVTNQQPPQRPFSTGNLTTAAWREGSLVYVLAIEGQERSYKQFIGAAPAFAWMPGSQVFPTCQTLPGAVL